MSANYLLMSDEMIKERTIVHGNTDPKLIYPDIKVAQDMWVLPIIGSALYKKLQDAVNDNDWTGLDDYKYLLNNYVLDTLQYFTMSELPLSMGYQFSNKGVIRKQGENSDLPSMSELVDLSSKYKERAQFYANRLRLYLKQNASEKFKEYNEPGTGVDTINPEKAYSIPIYLDDEGCTDSF